MTEDEQEAASVKYADWPKVIRLSSGLFALTGSFSNDFGLPILKIGTWAELEPIMQAYSPPERLSPSRSKTSTLTLEDLGL